MSILTSASGRIVGRGYDYYQADKVMSCLQIDDGVYKGLVEGSTNEPYEVVLNVAHPRKSTCTCPYADGHKICKHMTAMYFYLFPEEVEEYEDWLGINSYDDDEYYYDKPVTNRIEIPFCFDTLLHNYLNHLSKEEMKEMLYNELNKNKNATFFAYLQDEYQKFIQKDPGGMGLIEEVNNRIKSSMEWVDYDYYDETEELLTDKEKAKVKRMYKNKEFAELFDRIFFNPSLAIYTDYLWVVEFYKTRLNDHGKEELIGRLNDFFKSIKHYSIRNPIPKSQVLIVIYTLSEFTIKQKVELIIKNIKYWDYVVYVVENTKEKYALYEEFKKQMDSGKYKHKTGLPDVFLLLNLALKYNDKIYMEYHYYNVLFEKNRESMQRIIKDERHEEYINKIKANTDDKQVLELIYAETKDIDNLYKLIMDQNNEYLIIRNIDILKEKYNDELRDYFIHKFNEKLESGTGRKVYENAVQSLKHILELEEGRQKYEDIVENLRLSRHAKKKALFEVLERYLNKKYTEKRKATLF